MLTKQFAFFSSMLGLVLVNSLVGSSVTLVTTPVLIGLIWLASGTKYAIYAFAFWMLMATPTLIQFCFFYVDFLPEFFKTVAHLNLYTAAETHVILKFNYPTTWYIVFVVNLFFDCWATKTLGKKVLKQLQSPLRYRH